MLSWPAVSGTLPPLMVAAGAIVPAMITLPLTTPPFPNRAAAVKVGAATSSGEGSVELRAAGALVVIAAPAGGKGAARANVHRTSVSEAAGAGEVAAVQDGKAASAVVVVEVGEGILAAAIKKGRSDAVQHDGRRVVDDFAAGGSQLVDLDGRASVGNVGSGKERWGCERAGREARHARNQRGARRSVQGSGIGQRARAAQRHCPAAREDDPVVGHVVNAVERAYV